MEFDRRGIVITLLTALGLLVPTSIGLFLSGVPTILSPLPALTAIPALILTQWHLEYAVVLLPTLLFFDVESSAISCRRKNTQKNIRALRSICSPERRRFCTELEVGIAVPGSAIHGYRLLN